MSSGLPFDERTELVRSGAVREAEGYELLERITRTPLWRQVAEKACSISSPAIGINSRIPTGLSSSFSWLVPIVCSERSWSLVQRPRCGRAVRRDGRDGRDGLRCTNQAARMPSLARELLEVASSMVSDRDRVDRGDDAEVCDGHMAGTVLFTSIRLRPIH
jgi:hypothetical protein